MLAGRCRAADYLGPDRDPRAEQRAPESGDLSPAGDWPQQGDHALAQPPRRRPGLPRVVREAPGPAVPGLRGPRRGSGDHPWRGDSGPRHLVRIRLRRPVARQPHRTGQVPWQRPASAGHRRDHPRGCDSSGRDGAGRSVRRPHRLLQRSRQLPGVHRRAHHAPQKSDLSQHLHWPSAR
ncbi:hypothetical protein D9M71_562530 [compost metagenome]